MGDNRRTITSLVSELAEAAQGALAGGKAQWWPPATPHHSHLHRTRPPLDRWRNRLRAFSSLPKTNSFSRPPASDYHFLAPRSPRGTDGSAQSKYYGKGLPSPNHLFPLRLHRCVSRGKRKPPGYRKGAKRQDRRRYSQVQRPLRTHRDGHGQVLFLRDISK